MAIKLIANYAKRLGLPGFSSHQFALSVETEITTTDDLPGECGRLYTLLQTNVDGQVIRTGFVPPSTYGMEETPVTAASNNNNGNGTAEDPWKCSDKQRGLILKLVDEHDLDKQEIEELACERFGKGVRALGKLEASGLIDDLLDAHGGRNGGNSRRPRRDAYAGNRNGGGR